LVGTAPNQKPYIPSNSTTIDGTVWTSLPGPTRVLLLNQGGSPGVAAASNGIWVWPGGTTGSGNPLSRPTTTGDYVHAAALDNETVVRVSSGATLAHTEHACVTKGAITVDTTPIAHSRQLVRASVRDFGAVGNGVTDDSAAIAGAIAAVSAAVGAAVMFPPGTYLIGSGAAVTFPANVQLTFEEGASIATSVASQTINGRITAHPTQQIFGLALNPLNGAVTAGGSPASPVVTVSGFASSVISSFYVKITATGGLNAATFEYSLMSGSAGPFVTGITIPASGIYTIPGTGVTLNFPSGTYTAGATPNTYTWSSTAAAQMFLTAAAASSLPVKWFGAQGNGSTLATGITTANSPVLTNSAGTFKPTDVGKSIVVAGAGTGGANLVTTILSYTSGTSVTLSANASVALSGVSFHYGNDDSTAISRASSAISSGALLFTSGNYFVGAGTSLSRSPIPAGVQVEFEQGAVLTPSTPNQVTIAGPVRGRATQQILGGFGGMPSSVVGAGTGSPNTLVLGGLPTGSYNFEVQVVSGVGSLTGLVGGSNYANPPNVVFSPPPNGGITATATATVSGGAVNTVMITNPGSGYPAGTSVGVSFVNPGTGASATATVISGQVTQLTLGLGGSGYPPSLTLTLVPAQNDHGTGATATATAVNGVITSLQLITKGANYGSAPSVVFGGVGASVTPNLALNTLSGGIGFEYSLDGGALWSAPIAVSATSSVAYPVPGTGVILNFPSGSYATPQTWSWTASPPVLLTSQGSDAYPLKWWGCLGDGRDDDAPGLSNASQSIASGALIFAPGPYVVKESFSIPAGIRLTFEEGASLAPAGARVLINGRVTAHPTQPIFGGTGPVSTVTATGPTTPPSLTVTGAQTAYAFVVQVVATGSPGSGMTFKYSINGGTSFSAPMAGSTTPFSLSPTGGATITFGNVSYTAGDTYTWTSTPAVVLTSFATDVFPVRWWGATSLSPDSTAAIQSAIVACQSVGGGRVHLAAETYNTSAELALTAGGVWLEGAGNQFGNGTTLVATSAMRSMIKSSALPPSGSTAANRISDITLQCTNPSTGVSNATFGVYRTGDLFAEYRRVGIRGALVDGFHASSTADGYTIGPVTRSGAPTGPTAQVVPAPYTAPLVLGTMVVTVVTGGPLGMASFQLSLNGSLGNVVTPPASGIVQFSFTQFTLSTGVVWVFSGAGSYNQNDIYTCPITLTGQLNDFVRFYDCVIDGCGLIFGSSNSINMIGPTQYGNSSYSFKCQTPNLTGTVTMTQGSNVLVGAGTNFTAAGARAGDFIRLGFAAWQAGLPYNVGNTVTAGSIAVGVGPGQIPPGLLYVWQCTSVGPSGMGMSGSAVAWPTQGTSSGSSPIGMSVTDNPGVNQVVWTCVAYTTYQIMGVQDDQHIIVGAPPAMTLSNLDYAICVGSGSFDEHGSDLNESSWIGGSVQSAAAVGLMTIAPVGFKVQSFQCTYSGIAGFAVGLAGILCKNATLDTVYCENDAVADFWCECSGLTLIQPELGNTNGGIYCLDGSQSSYGTLIGSTANATSTVAMQAIGLGYSSIPVTESRKGGPFSIVGTLAMQSNTQYNIAAGTVIDPTISSLIYFNAVGSPGPAVVMTSTPTIAPGVNGQLLTLLNVGSTRLVLQSYTALPQTSGPPVTPGSTLALPSQYLTLGYLDSATFMYVEAGAVFNSPFWVLQSFNHVPLGVDDAGPTVRGAGLVAGLNSDFVVFGVSRMVIPAGQVAGAFAFGGLNGDSWGYFGISASAGTADGQDLLIINYCLQNMTFNHLDSNSQPANQIICPEATDVTVYAPTPPPAGGVTYTFARLKYSSLANGGAGAWLLLECSQNGNVASLAALRNLPVPPYGQTVVLAPSYNGVSAVQTTGNFASPVADYGANYGFFGGVFYFDPNDGRLDNGCTCIMPGALTFPAYGRWRLQGGTPLFTCVDEYYVKGSGNPAGSPSTTPYQAIVAPGAGFVPFTRTASPTSFVHTFVAGTASSIAPGKMYLGDVIEVSATFTVAFTGSGIQDAIVTWSFGVSAGTAQTELVGTAGSTLTASVSFRYVVQATDIAAGTITLQPVAFQNSGTCTATWTLLDSRLTVRRA
jgi:hypothetical protein